MSWEEAGYMAITVLFLFQAALLWQVALVYQIPVRKEPFYWTIVKVKPWELEVVTSDTAEIEFYLSMEHIALKLETATEWNHPVNMFIMSTLSIINQTLGPIIVKPYLYLTHATSLRTKGVT